MEKAKEVIHTLRNSSGASVGVTNVGAALVSVCVPDRSGRLADVALGYKELTSYYGDGAACGKTVGRYANRIALGRFTLDGTEYRLAQNNGPNALHGGVEGFANRLWDSRQEGPDRIVFSLFSPDGDQGYPGALHVEAIYEWSEQNELTITLSARSEAPTVINLTNHAYFNLAGENSGSVLGQTLRLNASTYLPSDSTQIPTGERAPVAGTPMDFRQPKPLGRDIDAPFEQLIIGKGYDHCFPLDGYRPSFLNEAARLSDPTSGRTLTILTTQPGIQLYTGNWLDGNPLSKSGRPYADRDGVALECQNFPDAPNQPDFPSPRLDPGQTYRETIVFKFGLI